MFRRRKPSNISVERIERKNLNRDLSNNPSIYENNAEVVRRVLAEGADPNFIREDDNWGRRSALSYAIVKNYSEVINIFKIFLNNPRTDVNNGNKYGWTPLIYTCMKYVSDEIGVELISLLLKHSEIQINIKNKLSGFSALHWLDCKPAVGRSWQWRSR